jgi:hypothetical protein
MDFGGILKRSWEITWRYKILWLFGLLAGGAGSGGGGFNTTSNYSFGENDFGDTDFAEFEAVGRWLEQYVVLLIGLAVLLVIIAIALLVISIAAKGGLIHLANAAEERRSLKAGDGWSVGFANWGRLFLIGLVLGLPLVIVLVIFSVVAIVPLVMGMSGGGGETAGLAVVGFCGAFVIGMGVMLVLALVIGVLDALASRHAVIDGERAMRSIGLAWTELRSRFKDIALMWLVMFGVGIAYGIVVGVVAMIAGVAIAFAFLGGAWPVALFLGFMLFLVMLAPTAIYSTFHSVAWTVFFRRLTGREAPRPPVRQAYPASRDTGYGVPAPPAPPGATAPSEAPTPGPLLPPPPPPPGG